MSLPPHQLERINEIFQETREQLNELELDHLKIEYESSDRVFFFIEPFSAEGTELKKRLEQQLEAVLEANPKAFETIMNAFTGKVYDERGDFGAQSREYKLTTNNNPAASLFYTLVERAFLSVGRVFGAEDTRPHGTRVLESEIAFNEPPERFRHLFETAPK